MPSGDYTYVLETVMSMQHTMGKLTEAVESLKTKQSQQGEKLDGIDKKIYAAIALVAVFGAILTFFAKSINDAVTSRFLTPSFQQQQITPPPSPQPTQQVPVQKSHN